MATSIPRKKKIYSKGCGEGGVLFTGPDGVCDYKSGVIDPTYVGIGTMSSEGTSELKYLWRAAKATNHPLSRHKAVGEVGWNITPSHDASLVKSGRQILRGEFRQLGEDRHTHLYQNPWTPHPSSKDYQNDRYGKEIFEKNNLHGRHFISCGKRCQCLKHQKSSITSEKCHGKD